MEKILCKCLTVGITVVFVTLNPNSASADVSADVAMAAIAAKLNRVEAAIAAGACTNCPTSLAILKADLAELKKLPDLRKEDRAVLDALGAKVDALGAKVDALGAKVDGLPRLTADEVVKQLAAKYGAGWETAARRGGNTCEKFVDGFGALKKEDTVALAALASAIGKCAEEGAKTTELAKEVCKNGGVVQTSAVTIVCDAPLPPSTPVLPPPLPPPAASSGSIGWALASGLAGAIVLGMTGYLVGGDVSPSYVDSAGVHRVGERDGAIIGGLLGAAVGAGVYALAK